jgi:hypothetical protein
MITIKPQGGCGCGSKLKAATLSTLPQVKVAMPPRQPVRQPTDIEMVLANNFPAMAGR